MSEEITRRLSIGLSTGGFNRFLEEGGGIDFRLDEACWSSLVEGDVVEFIEDPGQERRYRVKIIKLYRAASFETLLDSLPDALFDQSEKGAYLEFFFEVVVRGSGETRRNNGPAYRGFSRMTSSCSHKVSISPGADLHLRSVMRYLAPPERTINRV